MMNCFFNKNSLFILKNMKNLKNMVFNNHNKLINFSENSLVERLPPMSLVF